MLRRVIQWSILNLFTIKLSWNAAFAHRSLTIEKVQRDMSKLSMSKFRFSHHCYPNFTDELRVRCYVFMLNYVFLSTFSSHTIPWQCHQRSMHNLYSLLLPLMLFLTRQLGGIKGWGWNWIRHNYQFVINDQYHTPKIVMYLCILPVAKW